MTLEHIRSECSDVAASLQPYVDGELTDEEQERVAQHLEQCSGCRTAVSEQMWVRATLRAVERESAPRGLEAKILLRLDEVDDEAEDAKAAPPASPGFWRTLGARTRDLFKGGLVMLPAGAVAAALFFVARGGLEEAQTLRSDGMTSALVKAPAAVKQDVLNLAKLQPKLDFPIQVARPNQDKVQLVGAQLHEPAENAGAGARLKYRLHTGHHVINLQRPAGGPAPAGTPVTFRGQRYLVGRADNGAPIVHFERFGVAHMLRLEGEMPRLSADRDGGDTSEDFSLLLDMADHVAGAH